MKKIILVTMLAFSSSFALAQYKKDGSPDMRYKSNQEAYGNSNYNQSSVTPGTDVGYQHGYERNGTYVEPSYHTRSNSTNTDNWSTSGNTNPLTGRQGERARDYSSEATNYGQGHTIQTGSRGGNYYINSNGNRTYVPKQP